MPRTLHRPAGRDVDNVGVYLAKVTRVTGSECYVTVPSVGGAYEYGPAPYPAANKAGRRTDLAGQHADGAGGSVPDHRHTLTEDELAAGDRVAVAFLEGRRDELVVLVRLA